MANKTIDEKLDAVDQRINKLKTEKRKLQRQQKNEERKKRDHMLCRLAATFLTHYPEEVRVKLLQSSDEEIDAWVHGLFRKPDDTERG